MRARSLLRQFGAGVHAADVVVEPSPGGLGARLGRQASGRRNLGPGHAINGLAVGQRCSSRGRKKGSKRRPRDAARQGEGQGLRGCSSDRTSAAHQSAAHCGILTGVCGPCRSACRAIPLLGIAQCWSLSSARGAEGCIDYESIDYRIAYFEGRLKRWRDLIAKVSDSISSGGGGRMESPALRPESAVPPAAVRTRGEGVPARWCLARCRRASVDGGRMTPRSAQLPVSCALGGVDSG